MSPVNHSSQGNALSLLVVSPHMSPTSGSLPIFVVSSNFHYDHGSSEIVTSHACDMPSPTLEAVTNVHLMQTRLKSGIKKPEAFIASTNIP